MDGCSLPVGARNAVRNPNLSPVVSSEQIGDRETEPDTPQQAGGLFQSVENPIALVWRDATPMVAHCQLSRSALAGDDSLEPHGEPNLLMGVILDGICEKVTDDVCYSLIC